LHAWTPYYLVELAGVGRQTGIAFVGDDRKQKSETLRRAEDGRAAAHHDAASRAADSQMASASTASFFCRFKDGLT